MIAESGRHRILGVRLKITDRKISEIEALVVRPRNGYVFGAPEALEPDPQMTNALAPAARAKSW